MNSNQNKMNDFGENVHLRDGVNPVDERIEGSNSDSTDRVMLAMSAPNIEGQRDISLNKKLSPGLNEQTCQTVLSCRSQGNSVNIKTCYAGSKCIKFCISGNAGGEIQKVATGANEYGTSYRLQQCIVAAEHRPIGGLDQTTWTLLHSFSLHFRQPLQSSGNNSKVCRDVENGGGSGWHQRVGKSEECRTLRGLILSSYHFFITMSLLATRVMSCAIMPLHLFWQIIIDSFLTQDRLFNCSNVEFNTVDIKNNIFSSKYKIWSNEAIGDHLYCRKHKRIMFTDSKVLDVKKDGNLSWKDNVLAAAKVLTEASKLIDKQKLMETGKKRGPHVSSYNEEPGASDCLDNYLDVSHFLRPSWHVATVFPVHRHTSTIVHPQQSISLPQVRDDNSAREDYSHELRRLATFSALPATIKFFVVRLANAGFYCNQDKIIRCFFCNFEKSDWKLWENPLQIHQHRPQCPIVTGINCKNVPIMLPSAEQERELRQLWSLTEGKVASRPLQMQSVTSILQPVLGGTARNMSAGGAQALPPVAAFGQDAGANSTDSITSQPGLLRAVGTELVVDGTLEGSESKGRGESISFIAPGGPALQPEFQTASPGQPTPSQQLASNLVTNPNSMAQPATNASRVDSSSLSCNHSPNDSTSQPEGGSLESGPRTGEGQQVVTYQQLGILTESPKHPNMAVYQERINSFRNWPPQNNQTPANLVQAGFFYGGYGDCGRCFFCGGGLKNWEASDNPWIEHVRWFPRCAYIRQCQGQDFIDIVQFLNHTQQHITMEDVEREMNSRRAHGERLQETLVDPAIKSVTELGYGAAQVDIAVQQLRQQGLALTASHLIDLLQREGLQAAGGVDEGESDVEIEYLEELGKENSEIRQQHICKICLDRDVCIVFLPCGHLVCCAECSPALTTCPVCRQRIKGRVRAFSL